MIDPIQVPILLKAIDFVFDEGRKILEERRERRKTNDDPQKSDNQEPAKEITPMEPIEPEKEKEIKQDLRASKVDEILWQNHEAEVKHLVRLSETYSRNYHLAREQYAKWGSDLAPSIIVHRMTDAENSMLETIKQLEVILSKVYNKDIHSIE